MKETIVSVGVVRKAELRASIDVKLNGFVRDFYVNSPNASHFRDGRDLDLEYYKRHTIETILRIRRKRTCEARAIHYFTLNDPKSAKEWAEYSADEMLHDRLFVSDLERLGVSAEEIYATEPLFATKLLNGYFLYCNEFEGTPMAMLASSYFLEYTTRKTQPEWLDGLERSLGKENIKGARAHVNYDIAEDHTADVWNTLVTMVNTSDDELRLIGHFDNIYNLFIMYFRELYAVTRGPEQSRGD